MDNTGMCGDCGNWAIAYQRTFGGKLYYLYDEKDALIHVVVEKDNRIIDVVKKWKSTPFFEWYCTLWDLEEVDELYYIGLKDIDEIRIFKELKLTNEKRIKELMEGMKDEC